MSIVIHKIVFMPMPPFWFGFGLRIAVLWSAEAMGLSEVLQNWRKYLLLSESFYLMLLVLLIMVTLLGLIISDVIGVGFSKQKKLRVLFDTGALMTMIDKQIAEELQVNYTGKIIKITVLDGHEIVAREAIIRKLIILDEELNFERILVFDFPNKLVEKLKAMNCDNIVIGVLSIEAAGFVLDPQKKELRKVGFFSI